MKTNFVIVCIFILGFFVFIGIIVGIGALEIEKNSYQKIGSWQSELQDQSLNDAVSKYYDDERISGFEFKKLEKLAKEIRFNKTKVQILKLQKETP